MKSQKYFQEENILKVALCNTRKKQDFFRVYLGATLAASQGSHPYGCSGQIGYIYFSINLIYSMPKHDIEEAWYAVKC
jgi:hypothetical protein